MGYVRIICSAKNRRHRIAIIDPPSVFRKQNILFILTSMFKGGVFTHEVEFTALPLSILSFLFFCSSHLPRHLSASGT